MCTLASCRYFSDSGVGCSTPSLICTLAMGLQDCCDVVKLAMWLRELLKAIARTSLIEYRKQLANPHR